jgi:hypothetical protein
MSSGTIRAYDRRFDCLVMPLVDAEGSFSIQASGRSIRSNWQSSVISFAMK